ncbi:MAG: PPC domain-containing DNA-binding protein [bacterium]
MRWIKNGSSYQLRLLRGEEILETLSQFVQQNKIKSGVLFGLGAGFDFELGYYHLEKKVYHRRRFKGEFEIVSLVGNIAWEGKNPVCHCHIVLSDRRMATYGGHLFAGKVGATCEIAIFPGRINIQRELDPGAGLKLLKL